MVHSTFWYPKKGGSQFIADRIAEQLNVRVNASLNKIDLNNRIVNINNEEFSYGTLIYTGDIRKLSSLIGNQDAYLFTILQHAENLVSNGTSNVLCECDKTDLSWLYLPENDMKAHRIIYTGNFSPENNNSNERISCTVEFSGKLSENEMVFELGKLPGNLIPLAFNFEPNSYVIQTENSRKLISTIKEKLMYYDVYLLGRFAEWEYYNMDVCIEASMKLYKELADNYE
jgi:protoporphyrinogen oxidase